MKYYPVNLDIKKRKCLIIGGGSVGTRKVIRLVECGAHVTVVSPEVTGKLTSFADEGRIVLKKRSYQSSDLEGMFLVIGASDNKELNRQISEDARRCNIMCNIVDLPEACDFILPSLVSRGDLLIAISTSGKSPAFAKKLRRNLETEYGEEYAGFLKLMGAIRKKLLSKKHAPEVHRDLFERLIDKGVLEMIKKLEVDNINAVLFEAFGEGYEFIELMQSDG